jgi:hypothetical protein
MAFAGPMETRGINFWAHIRNWYEVRSLEDNVQLLAEVASYGFNDFWTTLERELFRNYLDEQVADDNSRQFWWKLKELAKFAKSLDMRVTVVDEFNTVFVDQCTDPRNSDLIAEAPRQWAWKKQVKYNFCPSKPRAREIILQNHENAYRDFPVIDAVVLQGYDPSGCGCDACQPWPETFFTFAQELAVRLRRYHAGAAMYLSAWDMSGEEVDILIDLLAADDKRTFQGVMDKEWLLLDIPNGGRPTERWAALPEDYKRIPYIDICQIGAWGWHCFTANPYPTRLETLFKALREAGITNYSAYSEDVQDDINKYLIARLGVSAERSAPELIREYCMRFFQAAVGKDVYKATSMMEEEYTNKLASPWEQKPIMDLASAREMLSVLKDAESRVPPYVASGWRWQVLIKRAEISVLLNEIGDLEETKEALETLLGEILQVKTAEEAHDLLQQADNLIAEKAGKLALLKETVDSHRSDVLQEPASRTIRVHKALPSYYDWKKMLIEMEETVGLATRIFVDGVQNAIKERLGVAD